MHTRERCKMRGAAVAAPAPGHRAEAGTAAGTAAAPPLASGGRRARTRTNESHTHEINDCCGGTYTGEYTATMETALATHVHEHDTEAPNAAAAAAITCT